MEWIGIVIFVLAVGGFIYYRANKKKAVGGTGSSGGTPGKGEDGGTHQDEVP